MSVAYYIALDRDEVKFDTFVNGKNIAQKLESIDKICKSNGLRSIEYFYSQDPSEFLDEFEELNTPESEVLWFTPEEGLDWLTKITKAILESSCVSDLEGVIQDLKEYMLILENAKVIKARWHLELDI